MRTKTYMAQVSCGTAVGDTGRGSVTTDFENFMVQKVTHVVLGVDDDTLFNDGQYLVAWRDDLKTYTDKAQPADLLFGSTRHGVFYNLPSPIQTKGNKTFSFDVSNLIDRSAYGPTFQIAFVLHGTVQD